MKTKLERCSPPATLVLHSLADQLVDPKETKLLYKYAKGKKELIIYPDGDHGLELPKKARREMLKQIVCWLKEELSL